MENRTLLIFFAMDRRIKEPWMTARQVVELEKPFDMVDALPFGSHPGNMTMRVPHFRIIHWPDIDDRVVASLRERGLPIGHDKGPTMFRASYLDLTHQTLPTDFADWWADDTRKRKIYRMPKGIPYMNMMRVRESEYVA